MGPAYRGSATWAKQENEDYAAATENRKLGQQFSGGWMTLFTLDRLVIALTVQQQKYEIGTQERSGLCKKIKLTQCIQNWRNWTRKEILEATGYNFLLSISNNDLFFAKMSSLSRDSSHQRCKCTQRQTSNNP